MSDSNLGSTFPPPFMPPSERESRNTIEKPSKIDLGRKEDDEFNGDSAEMAKDTGLLWLYEGMSPIDDKKYTFESQAQYSTSQTDTFSDIEYSMSNMSLNPTTRPQHFSSNNLQGYQSTQGLQFQAPRYHNYSSQAVVGSLQKPQDLKEEKCLYFDFELNEDFKVYQAPISYFRDMDDSKVYYRPLAEQVITYNPNSYVKCVLYFPPKQGGFQLTEKVYYGYLNLFELHEYHNKNVSLCLASDSGSKLIIN